MSAISQLYRQKPCVFSIECFPPKQTTRFAAMQDTLRRMKALDPDFISVTYGAGGSAGGVSSVQVASFLKNELGIQPLAAIPEGNLEMRRRKSKHHTGRKGRRSP